MTSARDREVERQVTALLDQKLISGANAAAFDAYLRFAHQNWHHYIADMATHLDLRAVMRETCAIPNTIVHQAPMTRGEFKNALAVLRRLAEIIAKRETTRCLIDKLVSAVDSEAALDAVESDALTSLGVFVKPGIGRVQMWVFILLFSIVVVLIGTVMAMKGEAGCDSAKEGLSRLSLWHMNLRAIYLPGAPTSARMHGSKTAAPWWRK